LQFWRRRGYWRYNRERRYAGHSDENSDGCDSDGHGEQILLLHHHVGVHQLVLQLRLRHPVLNRDVHAHHDEYADERLRVECGGGFKSV
jgi:hypothetical protein